MKTFLIKIVCISIVFIFAFNKSTFAKYDIQEVEGIKITRNLPDSTYLEQKIWVSVIFENTSEYYKTFIFQEPVRNANCDENGVKYIDSDYGEKFRYYEWKIGLQKGEKTLISYWIIPKNLGSYVISPSFLEINGKKTQLKSAQLEVVCLHNDSCDIKSGETYLNCPYDCKSGAEDNICNSISDKMCDPDCEKGADTDCIKYSSIQKVNLRIILTILVILLLSLLVLKLLRKK